MTSIASDDSVHGRKRPEFYFGYKEAEWYIPESGRLLYRMANERAWITTNMFANSVLEAVTVLEINRFGMR